MVLLFEGELIGVHLNFSQKMDPLIICADDFALNESTSRAILLLARDRKISATSAMTLSVHWPTQAGNLLDFKGVIDVGLHFDMTSEFAKSAGYGESLASVLLRSATIGYKPQSIADIFESQLDSFEKHWGAPPDHIDGHQHIHQFAGIRDGLLQVLSRRYAGQQQKPWIRVSKLRPLGLKAHFITLTGAYQLHTLLDQEGFAYSSVLLGTYGFNFNANEYRVAFRKWLQYAKSNTSIKNSMNNSTKAGSSFALMCHPGQGVVELDPIAQARQAEWSYLSSGALEDDLEEFALTLVRGGADAASSGA
jgi:chitin disaccharide deacetylase